MTAPPPEVRLHVDGAACDGHGICALVFPEGIALDVWGYASVVDAPLAEARLVARARRAARACPAGALTLVDDPRATARVAVVVGSRRARPRGSRRVEGE